MLMLVDSTGTNGNIEIKSDVFLVFKNKIVQQLFVDKRILIF